MKKIILWSVLFALSLWFYTYAGTIELSPSEWNYGKWCIFWVDVKINTENADIAAFDLIMEGSTTFYDFVPSDMFPYYFPPVVKWNVVHLVGFTTNPNRWINGSGSIWKVYFKSNPEDSDWSVKIYFAWKSDTTDSNLSIPWGVDTLSSVKDWYYTFTPDWECIDEHNIIWWYNWISYESWLNSTVNKINSDFQNSKMLIFWERLGVAAIFLILLILILWYLHKKWYLVRHKKKVSHS